MNATAPRCPAEPRISGAAPPAPLAATSRLVAQPQPSQTWLPDAWSWRRWSFLALAGAALAALAIGWLVGNGSSAARPVRVEQHDQVAANGVVEGAAREVALVPETAGALGVVYVRVNQQVEAGTLLFELRNPAQRAQVAVAAAQLKVAEAQHEQAKADYRRSQDIQRHRGAISGQDVDADLCRRQVAQAKVEEARAQWQLAEAELAKTQVRAPVAGRVLQIHKEVGGQVGPLGRGGQAEPVLRLADVSRRRVRAFVEELDAGRVQVGQQATATADGFPGQEFAGKVVEVAGRMGKDAPESDAPGEYKDVYYREVVIELDGGLDLPLNLRVQVRIAAATLPNSY